MTVLHHLTDLEFRRRLDHGTDCDSLLHMDVPVYYSLPKETSIDSAEGSRVM
jgi:hypothetical protein